MPWSRSQGRQRPDPVSRSTMSAHHRHSQTGDGGMPCSRRSRRRSFAVAPPDAPSSVGSRSVAIRNGFRTAGRHCGRCVSEGLRGPRSRAPGRPRLVGRPRLPDARLLSSAVQAEAIAVAQHVGAQHDAADTPVSFVAWGRKQTFGRRAIQSARSHRAGAVMSGDVKRPYCAPSVPSSRPTNIEFRAGPLPTLLNVTCRTV